MGSTHFPTRTLTRVCTEISLHVLAHNMKRVIARAPAHLYYTLRDVSAPAESGGHDVVRSRVGAGGESLV